LVLGVDYGVHIYSDRDEREDGEIWGELQPEGKIVKIIRGGTVTIHSSEHTTFSFTHIEGITQGAGEAVGEVAGGASGIGYVRLVTGLVKDRLLECMGLC
jgi:hypothetical protein